MMTDAVWPILVLTLPGDDARRAPLVQALERLGLPYELFFGVDGRQGLAECWEGEIDRVAARRRMGHEMADGEFACALSHREIYRKVVERGWPGAVVLEDDAILGDAFATFIQGRHYERAGLILLDHGLARVRGPAEEMLPGVWLRRLAVSPYRASGYSVAIPVAQALLNASSPIRWRADWPMDLVELGAMALDPTIVGPPDFQLGTSQLRDARDHVRREQGYIASILHRLQRWSTRSYWRHWLRKRLSTRIS